MTATPEHAARVLGLNDDATLEDVRRARRELAFKYHPDRSDDPSRSSRHMARINDAADTLIAYLKKQTRPINKQGRPDSCDFSTQKNAKTTAARPDMFSRKPASNQAGACETKGHNRCAVSTSAEKPKCKSTPSNVDNALIRLAAISYRNVLDRIGKIDPGPTVDTRALSYT